MSDSPDKFADQQKKFRKRTGEGEGLPDSDEEKASVVADASIEPIPATPVLPRTVEKPAKKVSGATAPDVPGRAGQAARMRFRRDRRPRR